VRILITGSRRWTDRVRLEAVLWYETTRLHPERPLTIVHGDCPYGADRMVREWCETHPDITEERHPADWNQFGKSAGFKRNAEMVSLGADLCIAFIVPGMSRGTEHSAGAARRAGIPVTEVVDHATH
jgi:hypothetical protein